MAIQLQKNTKKDKNFLRKARKSGLLDTLIMSCDFETLIYQNKHYPCAYAIVGKGIYKGIINKCVPEKIEQESNKLIEKFLNDCRKIRALNRNVKFLFHNLGKFDGIFLINYSCNFLDVPADVLMKDDNIYRIIINLKFVKIIFQDSYLLIKLSLKKLGESFNKEYKKSTFSHQESYEKYIECDVFREELLKYCINDCQVLNEAYPVFRKIIFDLFGLDCSQSLTISALAMKIFRSNFLPSQIENTALNPNKENFLRRAYTGASVEIYKPYLETGFHYDVNSLYASVMAKYDYPVGKGVWVSGKNIDLNKFFGFVEVEVECPEMYRPLLNYRNKDDIYLAGYGTWKGVYFSEELIEAEKLGYKFKFLQGLEYQRGVIFKDYVDKVYNLRLQSPKNTPLNVTGKILLNGLYGKFGARNDTSVTEIISKRSFSIMDFPGAKEITDLGRYYLIVHDPFKEINPTELVNVISVDSRGKKLSEDDIYDYYDKRKEKYKIFSKQSAIQLAAAITSYGRLEIYKYKTMSSLDCYYSDTDSIFCRNEMDPAFVSENQLGFMKLEGTFKDGIFISPKLYYYEPDNQILPIIKSKGGAADLLTKENFLDLLKKDKEFPFSPKNFFKIDRKNFSVGVESRSFTVTSSLRKRTKVYNQKGNWIDTGPIKIDE